MTLFLLAQVIVDLIVLCQQVVAWAMDGDLEARTDVGGAGTDTGEEEGEGHLETTPKTEQTPSAEEPQTAPDLPKAPEDNDDDVVLVEEPPARSQGRVQPPSPTPAETLAAAKNCAESATTATASSKEPSPPASAATTGTAASSTAKSQSEPIVIDDEEDSELKGAASFSLLPPEADDALSSTEPDSEIKIASVTTLGMDSLAVAMASPTATPLALCAQEDINLMITNVTSLKDEGQSSSRPVGGFGGGWERSADQQCVQPEPRCPAEPGFSRQIFIHVQPGTHRCCEPACAEWRNRDTPKVW